METPGPRSHSEIASNTEQTEAPSGPVIEGNLLFVSLIAGNLAADVGCPFALHDKALLVVVSVYMGTVLRYY